jgi:hypothetical protein
VGLRNLRYLLSRTEVDAAVSRTLREPLRRYADIIAQFDADVLVLAGRTSKLEKVADLILDEMPVTAPRLKLMSRFAVGDWYPSKWRDAGIIRDPKSTVTAGATILHLARAHELPGFLLDQVETTPHVPIFGIYQDTEPHVPHGGELFVSGDISGEFLYTARMRIGVRNVASEEMDGAPLFEIRPASPRAMAAVRTERILISFARERDGSIRIHAVKVLPPGGGQAAQPTDLGPQDFVLALRTAESPRYWLDTGVLNLRRYVPVADLAIGHHASAEHQRGAAQ